VKGPVLIKSVVHAFRSADNIILKLGYPSGTETTEGEDVLDHVISLAIPVSAFPAFNSELAVAEQILVSQQVKAIEVEPEEIAVTGERLGRPFNVKK
jgi:hypothetical protein